MQRIRVMYIRHHTENRITFQELYSIELSSSIFSNTMSGPIDRSFERENIDSSKALTAHNTEAQTPTSENNVDEQL